MTTIMATVEDGELYEFAYRLKGSVIIITGAANGIGRNAAIEFAKHGYVSKANYLLSTHSVYSAKVVIGDLDEAGGASAVSEIKAAGGEGTFLQTNVLDYVNLAALFQHAMKMYGKVDVVVPCAGVTEYAGSTVGVIKLDDNGVPKRPNLKTTEINLLSVMNSTPIFNATRSISLLAIN